MIRTYNRFIKATLRATDKAIKEINFPYLEVTETRTTKDKTHYRGIMIKSNHPDAPYASSFYLEEAFRDNLINPYDIDEFATELILQFLLDYNYVTSCMAD